MRLPRGATAPGILGSATHKQVYVQTYIYMYMYMRALYKHVYLYVYAYAYMYMIYVGLLCMLLCLSSTVRLGCRTWRACEVSEERLEVQVISLGVPSQCPSRAPDSCHKLLTR